MKVLSKKSMIIVRLFLAAILLISAFSCFMVSSFASGAPLTEAKAKELLYGAYRIYMTYQDGSEKKYGGTGSLVTVQRDAVSSEAHSVYVDEIADNAWTYQCSMPAQYRNSEDRNNWLTYSDNHDGTVTFVSFFPMGYREYTIRTKFEVTTVPSLDDPKHVFYWPEKPEDIIIKDLTSDGASAGAKVLMSREYPDFSPEPIWVDVFFSNTNSGWRISGGSYVYALTDWENADLKYEVAYRHFPNAFTIRAIIASVYLKKIVSVEDILQDSQSVLPDNYFDSGKAVVRWEVLSINDNRFELLVEFAEGNNSENYPPQYVFEPSGKNRTYNAVFTRNNDGKFVLTDGGVYELANGKTDVAPATGDDNLSRIYAIAAVAVLSAMICAAAVTVRRRKSLLIS